MQDTNESEPASAASGSAPRAAGTRPTTAWSAPRPTAPVTMRLPMPTDENEEEWTPPEFTGWVRCRGCGWYGREEDTIFTNNEHEECAGDEEGAESSCPVCRSSDLADAHPEFTDAF